MNSETQDSFWSGSKSARALSIPIRAAITRPEGVPILRLVRKFWRGPAVMCARGRNPRGASIRSSSQASRASRLPNQRPDKLPQRKACHLENPDPASEGLAHAFHKVVGLRARQHHLASPVRLVDDELGRAKQLWDALDLIDDHDEE